MDSATVTTTRILTWAGLIPFAGLALVIHLPAPGWLESLLVAYATLILAFMAGTLWTRHLLGEESHPRMLIASNILVLAAWPAMLMPTAWAAVWLGALFGAHLLLDEPWRGYGMPAWYRGLRLVVSGLVIALLLISGLSRIAAHG